MAIREAAKAYPLNLDHHSLDFPKNSAFRMMTLYDIMSDDIYTRFDFKFEDKQIAAGFWSSPPQEYDPKFELGPSKLFIVRDTDALKALNLYVNKEKFIASMKKFVADLENN